MSNYERTKELIGQYIAWQEKNVNAREDINGRVFIETPFARADGHHLELEVCHLGNGLVRLSDGGETLDELWMQGGALSSEELSAIEDLARCFRVKLTGDEYLLTNEGKGGARQIQDLVSAILAISSLIVAPKSRTGGKSPGTPLSPVYPNET